MYVALEGDQATLVDTIDDPEGRSESLCGQSCGEKECAGQYTEGERTQIFHLGFLDPFFGENPGETEKLLLRVNKHRRVTARWQDVVGLKAKVIIRCGFTHLDGMGRFRFYKTNDVLFIGVIVGLG
jgi:hypothetical protein